jgi:hypothetical protein
LLGKNQWGRLDGRTSMPKQTFLRLIEDLIEDEDEQEVGGVFEPDDIAIMTSAFDRILSDLKLVRSR